MKRCGTATGSKIAETLLKDLNVCSIICMNIYKNAIKKMSRVQSLYREIRKELQLRRYLFQDEQHELELLSGGLTNEILDDKIASLKQQILYIKSLLHKRTEYFVTSFWEKKNVEPFIKSVLEKVQIDEGLYKEFISLTQECRFFNDLYIDEDIELKICQIDTNNSLGGQIQHMQQEIESLQRDTFEIQQKLLEFQKLYRS